MNSTQRQMRTATSKFETREAENELYIEGYFAVFGSNYELWDGASESVEQGAFSETLENDVRALVDHDTRIVLGRTRAETLELREDNHGLWGRIRVNRDDGDAMNLYHRVKRGDVDQCSFGFDILDQETERDEAGKVHWTIKKVKLYEVSVVTFPAYEETGVVARRRDMDDLKRRRREEWKEAMKKRVSGKNEEE